MHLSATGKGKPGPNSGISSTVPNLSYFEGAIHKGCPHIFDPILPCAHLANPLPSPFPCGHNL